jgi:hypothetical protein
MTPTATAAIVSSTNSTSSRVRPDDFGCSWNDCEDARVAGGADGVCRAGAGDWGLRLWELSCTGRRPGIDAGRGAWGTGLAAAGFGAGGNDRACRGGVERVGMGDERGDDGGAGNGADGGATFDWVFSGVLGAARDGVDGVRGGAIVPVTDPTAGSGSPRRTAATASANSPPVP